MRRVMLVEPERFVIEEVPIPQPKPGEVIVQVEQSGICGSDIHMYHGVSPIKPPLVMGHEFVGKIYQVGSEVSGWQIGDRVIVEPGVPCWKCTYCLSGRYNLCPRQYTIGGWVGHDGGYADYVHVPANRLLAMPDSMTFKVAAMVEPTACAMHVLELANIHPGDNVLILGSGTIGLLISQAVRLVGAARVTVTDVLPTRLELAQTLGADYTVNAKDTDVVEWANETFGEGGVARVFDTVSIPTTFHQAVKIVRRGGRIINVGVATRPVEFNTNILLSEIELTGMNMYVRRNFEDAIKAIVDGRVRVEPLVSASYPLGQIEEAYHAVVHEPDRVIKVQLAPQAG